MDVEVTAESLEVALTDGRRVSASLDWIRRQISAWDPGNVTAVTAKVRQDCADRDTAAELAAIYEQVVGEYRNDPPADLEAELEAIASAMGADVSTRVNESQERIRSMENSWSWRVTHPLRIVDKAFIRALRYPQDTPGRRS